MMGPQGAMPPHMASIHIRMVDGTPVDGNFVFVNTTGVVFAVDAEDTERAFIPWHLIGLVTWSTPKAQPGREYVHIEPERVWDTDPKPARPEPDAADMERWAEGTA